MKDAMLMLLLLIVFLLAVRGICLGIDIVWHWISSLIQSIRA